MDSWKAERAKSSRHISPLVKQLSNLLLNVDVLPHVSNNVQKIYIYSHWLHLTKKALGQGHTCLALVKHLSGVLSVQSRSNETHNTARSNETQPSVGIVQSSRSALSRGHISDPVGYEAHQCSTVQCAVQQGVCMWQ